jgi:cysteine-rich repeat protein
MLRLLPIAVLAVAGCFTPAHEQCAVSCGADNGCPPGFTCLSDNFCHASAADSLCSISNNDGGIDAPDIDAGPGCGDGIRDTSMNEECDDNNGDDGDGCSAICREESGFVCVGDNGELSTCRPNPSEAGQLVITEMLANPTDVTDDTHEWFELFNPTDTDFDLRDMRISDDGGESFVVNRSVVILAGDHIVLGKSDNMGANGGVEVAFAYGGSITLGNGADEVRISFPGVLIDETGYNSTPEGASISLSAQVYDHVSNDSVLNFCDGVDSFGDNGDLGTPGMLNPDC